MGKTILIGLFLCIALSGCYNRPRACAPNIEIPAHMVVDVALLEKCLNTHGGVYRTGVSTDKYCQMHSLRKEVAND